VCYGRFVSSHEARWAWLAEEDPWLATLSTPHWINTCMLMHIELASSLVSSIVGRVMREHHE
jgi:hypothetical protein